MPYQPRATFDNPYGPQVLFRTEDVLPPTAYYVGLDDQIVWNIHTDYAPATYYLVVRMLSAQGVITVETRTLSNAAAGAQRLSSTLTGMEGYVLSACVSAPGVPLSSAYVYLTLMRSPSVASGIITALLTSGYVSDTQFISFPTTAPLGPLAGPAQLKNVTAAAAAGSDWALTCPAKTRWNIANAEFQLVTSAAVGNRLVAVEIGDMFGNTCGFYFAAATQPASTTQLYSLNPGGQGGTNNYLTTIPASSRIIVEDGGRIASATGLIQAGDQYSSVVVQVEEWVGL